MRKPVTMLAVAIFALMALAHAYRLATGCEVVVNGTRVPLWVSWAGLIVAAGLFGGRRGGSHKPTGRLAGLRRPRATMASDYCLSISN